MTTGPHVGGWVVIAAVPLVLRVVEEAENPDAVVRVAERLPEQLHKRREIGRRAQEFAPSCLRYRSG
jgi:hypothetical protein